MPACSQGNALDLLACHLVLLSLATRRTSEGRATKEAAQRGRCPQQSGPKDTAGRHARQLCATHSARRGSACCALQQGRPCMAGATQAGGRLPWIAHTWLRALFVVAGSQHCDFMQPTPASPAPSPMLFTRSAAPLNKSTQPPTASPDRSCRTLPLVQTCILRCATASESF